MHQACNLLVAGGGLSGLSARRIEMRLTNGCGGGVIMNSKTSEELASLMDIVLPGGVRLGDATRQQVMEAVEHYRKQQEKYTAKARQCCEALYLRFPVRQR
jgi:hypothetical protein